MLVNKYYFFIVLLFFLQIKISCGYYSNQPRWDEYLNFNEIEKALINSTVSHMKCISKCETKIAIYLVTLSNGLQAIFKTRRRLSILAEIAAYRASKFLNQYLVPPTVLRTINNIEGSLQFFVTNSNDKKVDFDSLEPKIRSNFLLFSFIFGNWDWNKHGRNIIMQVNKNKLNIAAIDNEWIHMIQKAQYGDLPFFKLNYSINSKENTEGPFPFDKAKAFNKEFINNLSTNLPKIYFSRYLPLAKKCIIYKNFVWIQPSYNLVDISFTKIYYKSTLEAYKKLTKEILEKIWNFSSDYHSYREHFSELFDDVLDRRNQVLLAAKKGIIIDD